MRTFGKDSPKFMAFKVEGDDTTYKLPLSGSIRAEYNVRLYRAMSAGADSEREYLLQELMLDMFREYLGDGFVDALDVSTMLDIWRAWQEESAKANQEPGE